MPMPNPLAGLDLMDPWHWPYFIMLLLTPPVFLVCLVFIGVGWLAFVVWFVILMETRPVEVERAMNRQVAQRRSEPY